MLSLQVSTENIHKVITWNDATVPGISIAVALAAIAGMYYLFKINQEQAKTNTERIEQLYKEFSAERDRIYKEHLNDTKGFNELLVKITNQYHDYVRIIDDFRKK